MRFLRTFINNPGRRLSLQLALITMLLPAIGATAMAQLDNQGRWEHGLDLPNSAWNLPKLSTHDLNDLIKRWNSIGAEITHTSNKFAGTYWSASNHASFLRWAPENGFVYLKTYEGIDVVDFSYGSILVTPSNIRFLVERELRLKFFGRKLPPTPSYWVPAERKQRYLLVEANRIRDFGMYVAGFGEFNDFTGPCCEFAPFLVSFERSRDVDNWSDGPTWVPEAYAQLMKKPIEATIFSVGPKRLVDNYGLAGTNYSHLFIKASLTPVRINAGSNRGVKRGLLLRILNAPPGQYLRITSVRKTSAAGVVIRDLDDNGEETYYDSNQNKMNYPPIVKHARVTTSPP